MSVYTRHCAVDLFAEVAGCAAAMGASRGWDWSGGVAEGDDAGSEKAPGASRRNQRAVTAAAADDAETRSRPETRARGIPARAPRRDRARPGVGRLREERNLDTGWHQAKSDVDANRRTPNVVFLFRSISLEFRDTHDANYFVVAFTWFGLRKGASDVTRSARDPSWLRFLGWAFALSRSIRASWDMVRPSRFERAETKQSLLPKLKKAARHSRHSTNGDERRRAGAMTDRPPRRDRDLPIGREPDAPRGSFHRVMRHTTDLSPPAPSDLRDFSFAFRELRTLVLEAESQFRWDSQQVTWSQCAEHWRRRVQALESRDEDLAGRLSRVLLGASTAERRKLAPFFGASRVF
jgi:hypothetical protein